MEITTMGRPRLGAWRRLGASACALMMVAVACDAGNGGGGGGGSGGAGGGEPSGGSPTVDAGGGGVNRQDAEAGGQGGSGGVVATPDAGSGGVVATPDAGSGGAVAPDSGTGGVIAPDAGAGGVVAPPDAGEGGVIAPDAGEGGAVVPVDAARPTPDAALPEPDAALPDPDAALPDPDASLPEPDAALPEPDAAVDPLVAYTLDEVIALVQANCSGCHTNGGASGGMRLDDFVAATIDVPSNEAPGFDRIEPGDRMRSYLYRKISGTHLDPDVQGMGARMPFGGRLTDAQIERVGLFIDALPVRPPEDCAVAGDEDANGAADCDDPECFDAAVCQAEICDNAVDDDADDLVDCDDPACESFIACRRENCANSVDDNGNDLSDCDDPECVDDPVCLVENCANDLDDNDNGLVDCEEASCAPALDCRPFTQEDLQALINVRCNGCHVGGGQSGGMRLDAPFTANTVNVPANRVPALDRIEPGQHENSFLWRKLSGLQGANGGSRMPLGGPFLTNVQLRRIALYIDGL